MRAGFSSPSMPSSVRRNVTQRSSFAQPVFARIIADQNHRYRVGGMRSVRSPRHRIDHQLGIAVVGDDAGKYRLREGGSLRDISPTLLGMLGLEKPARMTGGDLRVKLEG